MRLLASLARSLDPRALAYVAAAGVAIALGSALAAPVLRMLAEARSALPTVH